MLTTFIRKPHVELCLAIKATKENIQELADKPELSGATIVADIDGDIIGTIRVGAQRILENLGDGDYIIANKDDTFTRVDGDHFDINWVEPTRI